MSANLPRPLPGLQLPAAFLSFWPADPATDTSDTQARQVAAAYAKRPGVVQLGERRFALVPEMGREHVFDDALALGQAILAHLRKSGADREITGILVHPAEIRLDGKTLTPVEDELAADLAKRPPRFKSPGIFLTGYAASWLRSRFQFDSAGLYEGPSGRRVPMHRVLGEAPELGPWHNPELLGRQVKVPRPRVRLDLEKAKDGVLRVLGPLGSGKSHAVWHYLLEQEGPKLWFRVRRSLFGTAGLARHLVRELHRLAPESLPAGGDELRRPESLAPVRAAELLSVWLDNACRQLGATLWIVCDVVQSAVEGDLDLLANLLARRGLVFRMILISRSGGPVVSQLVDLPQMEIPPMDEEEFQNLSQQLFAGLSLGPSLAERLPAAAEGYPFALEEGLTDLIHRGLIRRVYGNFFYSGPSDVGYQPSRRLVRHVAAEAERLGEGLPLRILAAAEQAVPPLHLETACAAFGLELPLGWDTAFTNAGWLKEAVSVWGEGLAFDCPAYSKALLETVSADSVESLRQALGQAMVSDTPSGDLNWQTYQLMAGTADALPSLLQLSKKADTAEARQELFEALETEYELHKSRQGDEATELDLLWKLLPLGHRLGKLSQLEEELARSLQLAVGDVKRFAALALVKAEHDQSQGRHREAVKGIQAALMASEGASDQRRALIVIRLGKILLGQERTEGVRKLFTDLLGLAGTTMLGATCHFYLGEAALLERDLEAAEVYHEKALEMRRRQNQPKPLSASLAANGAVAQAHGDYSKSFDLYSQAKELLDEQDEDELAEILLGLGRAQGHLGDPTAATPNLRRALELLEGRGSTAELAAAHLSRAKNHLDLGHVDRALTEARKAHFRLSLLPSSTLLGDATRLLGQILYQTQQVDEAEEYFREALRIHLDLGRRQAAALDSSWLLQIALVRNNKSEILNQSAELDALAEVPHPVQGDLIFYRLYLAFDWLRTRGTAARDPVEYLRQAHRELMRKLGYLQPQMRQQFLFNVREHEELLNAAVEHQISLPSFSAAAFVRDSPHS